ncbi:Plexin domain-containing protein 2 [Dermatophagoides pteronyssinus]|uniref:Plexin domain-containing protein 2 n=1 Tax=Dermatophagoides pteronyssinus TaxID=6956 RepID=A0ABQ8JVZ4_DERPT|nr:Plexin domain-containing protein 2 [Dermatophagoides pteronyssinus]
MDNFKLASILLLLLIVIQSIILVHCLDNGESETSKLKNTVKKATLFDKKLDAKLMKQSALLEPTKLTSSSSSYNGRDLINQTIDETTITGTEEDFDENKAFHEYEEETNRTKSDAVLKMNFSYFEMEFIQDPEKAMNLWIDVKSFNDSNYKHEVLSNSHRRAAAISLPFNFSFYGHNLTKITVATGGFLYMGEHVHAWLAATQYIAPLMANFDTRNSSRAQILYGFNSTVFVVQWDNVRLQSDPDKEFTFQCSIYSNGDIAFVYKQIPVLIDKINENEHPVKVGVSDAYFIHRQQIFVRRKTIYEYHKIDLRKNEGKLNIRSGTAIFLKALPTCSKFRDCHSCLTGNSSFSCVWCDSVERCSDGYDRLRQEWVANRCDHDAINEVGKCAAPLVPSLPISNQSTTNGNSNIVTPSPTIFHNSNSSAIINEHHANGPSSDNIDIHSDKKNLTNLEYNTQEQRIGGNISASSKNRASMAHSSLAISLFFVISLVLGVSLWILYAFRYPTSSSGLFLIRWRPSAWRWNTDTRYTAASIHM